MAVIIYIAPESVQKFPFLRMFAKMCCSDTTGSMQMYFKATHELQNKYRLLKDAFCVPLHLFYLVSFCACWLLCPDSEN